MSCLCPLTSDQCTNTNIKQGTGVPQGTLGTPEATHKQQYQEHTESLGIFKAGRDC